MEALRSAEALQVHWDAAHGHSTSGAGAAAAAGDEPVKQAKPVALTDDGSSAGPYVPQLPANGCDNELLEYKSLVKKMSETINVS